MTVNEFLQKYRKMYKDNILNVTRPRIKCADGFTISVQAGYGIYSRPRQDASHYTRVELGYPSEPDELIEKFAENPKNLRQTVYGYVPVELVDELLEKHGGIIGVDMSNQKGNEKWEV